MKIRILDYFHICGLGFNFSESGAHIPLALGTCMSYTGYKIAQKPDAII